jgi:hypothetical protein
VKDRISGFEDNVDELLDTDSNKGKNKKLSLQIPRLLERD